MKLPWHNKTGIPKAIAILATMFMVSIGLCGANFVAFLKFGTLEQSTWASNFLLTCGWIELGAIIGSLLALAVLIAFEPRGNKRDPRRNSNQKGTD